MRLFCFLRLLECTLTSSITSLSLATPVVAVSFDFLPISPLLACFRLYCLLRRLPLLLCSLQRDLEGLCPHSFLPRSADPNQFFLHSGKTVRSLRPKKECVFNRLTSTEPLLTAAFATGKPPHPHRFIHCTPFSLSVLSFVVTSYFSLPHPHHRFRAISPPMQPQKAHQPIPKLSAESDENIEVERRRLSKGDGKQGSERRGNGGGDTEETQVPRA